MIELCVKTINRNTITKPDKPKDIILSQHYLLQKIIKIPVTKI